MPTTDHDDQAFSTIADLAVRWRCDPKTIRRRITASQLAAHFMNGRWLISNADRNAFEAIHRHAPKS